MDCPVINFQKKYMYCNLFSGMRLQQDCEGNKVHLFFFGKGTFLSNFAPSTFTYDGNIFTSAEQAFEFTKAKFLNDDDAAEKVLNLSNTTDMATTGMIVLKNKNEQKLEEWYHIQQDVMYSILKAKFSQNKDLLEQLLRTKPMELVEANPYDRFFGIGLSMNNPKVDCRHQWQGKNRMGKLLEELRSELSD